MHKKKIGHVVQLMALLMFIVMALACASQQSAVGTSENPSGAGGSGILNEGAAIETPIDSIANSYDYALN